MMHDAEAIRRAARCGEDMFLDILRSSGLHVLSVFVVGSFAAAEVPKRHASDLDLRAIAEHPKSSQMRCVFDGMDRAARALSTSSLLVRAGYRVGVQRVASREPSLLFHIVLLQPEDLASLPATHLRGYASNYRLLAGTDVLASFRGHTFTASDLLNSPEGIRDCAAMLRMHELRFLEWDLTQDQPILVSRSVEMDEVTLWDVTAYAALKSVTNTAIVLGYSSSGDLHELLRNESWPGLSRFRDFLNRIDELRRDDPPPMGSTLRNLSDETLDLLEWLEETLCAETTQ